jgi:hypothetical protein
LPDRQQEAVMDFANFAGIEFVRAIQAQREHDRSQKKWLVAWRDLQREARAPQPPKPLPAPAEEVRRRNAA